VTSVCYPYINVVLKRRRAELVAELHVYCPWATLSIYVTGCCRKISNLLNAECSDAFCLKLSLS
jgi:hypothetical protein